jgi:hypothetical protein
LWTVLGELGTAGRQEHDLPDGFTLGKDRVSSLILSLLGGGKDFDTVFQRYFGKQQEALNKLGLVV